MVLHMIISFADVFENFRNKCIEIHELDPAYSAYPAWQAV